MLPLWSACTGYTFANHTSYGDTCMMLPSVPQPVGSAPWQLGGYRRLEKSNPLTVVIWFMMINDALYFIKFNFQWWSGAAYDYEDGQRWKMCWRWCAHDALSRVQLNGDTLRQSLWPSISCDQSSLVSTDLADELREYHHPWYHYGFPLWIAKQNPFDWESGSM